VLYILVCFRYKGTVRTSYGTGVRIGVQVFVPPSVALYENNAKRNIGFRLVVVEYLYPTRIHLVYGHNERFWMLFGYW